MSMPKFPKPDPDLTREQALTMILSSIALEELALSHIMNAEGEKIQYILNQSDCCQDPADLAGILAVNKSVGDLLEMVLQNQLILKNKMDKVLEFLPVSPVFDRFHEDSLGSHKGKLFMNMFFDYLWVNHHSGGDVQINIQNCIRG